MDCATLRWQVKLRALNMWERALAYTATDAVNGCWGLLDRVVAVTTGPSEAVSDACAHEPDDPHYWNSPCCNPRVTKQCCAVRNVTLQRVVAIRANTSELALHCQADPAGGAAHARAAALSAVAWRRRLVEVSGAQSCWKALGIAEQSHTETWRTLERCHADVMGRYDRELGMYIGVPCLADEDCFTECLKPSLRTLRIYVAISLKVKESRDVLGRCRVPTVSRHVFLLRCLAQRAGPEAPGQSRGLTRH